MTRLLLVDDHASSREPLALLLAGEPGISKVVQATTIAEARPHLAETDLAIVDVGLPDGDGVTLIHLLRRERPDAPILVLTASLDRQVAARAVAAGAAAVLNKSISLAELRHVLRRLLAGEAPVSDEEELPAGMLTPATETVGPWRLSPREQEVLQGLADGLTDREIGQRLGIGIETIRTHMAGIFAKFGVESRLQALAFAVRRGLVHPTPADENDAARRKDGL